MSHEERTAKKTVTVIVNGRPKEFEKGEITYEEVIHLAFDNPPTGPNIQFTVVYTRGVGNKPAGTLTEGETVQVKDRMEFDVTPTNKS